MSWLLLKCALLLLSVAFSLSDGKTCTEDDVTPIANQCIEPDQLFNSSVSVLPGSTITLTCSVRATVVQWNNSQFAMPVVLTSIGVPVMESGITFQLDTVTVDPTCSNATATITNIQESMDGLDLTCYNEVATLEFTSTVTFDVIDPPDPVTSLNITQICNAIVTNWTAPTNQSCSITGYSVNISLSGDMMSEIIVETNYTLFVNSSFCNRILEISVFAISAAGMSNAATSSITVICTPTDISVVEIKNDTSALVEWTHNPEVSGVEMYMAMSMPSSSGSVTIADMLTDVINSTVGVDSFTVDVTFVVTSLTAENDMCFAIDEILPAIKDDNMVDPDFEVGTVTFPFKHPVMDITVSPSPVDASCSGSVVSQTDVIVSCTDLASDIQYTVTLEGTLSVNGTPLLFTFSESFIPTSSRTSSSPTAPTPTTNPPPPGGNQALTVSVAVVVLVIAFVAIAMLMVVVIVCIKKRKHKVSLGLEQEGDGPIALVEKKAKDPNTGEVGPYDVAIDGQEKQVPHQAAPTGDEYAVVEKQPGAARRAAPSTPQVEAMTYQDPNTIQRQEAPTGDLYALPQKKGEETKESMPMYSEVNKQPERVYADLALSKGGDSGVNRQPPTQEGFVTYSEILPAAGPPARPPKPQESIPEKSLYSEIQQAPPPPSPLAEQDSMIDVPEEESLYEKYH